jgi:C-terminal processing protease CtpA/Prc
MKTAKLQMLGLAMGLALAGCSGAMAIRSEQPASGTVAMANEPVEISGKYSITNDFIFTYYVENAVALLDMHGFVIRDDEWELPVESQVLGFMTYDPKSKGGDFDLNLPALPRGELNDVDQNGKNDKGVQVFAVGYSPNQAGGPFAEGDDRSRGWPSYLASVRTDSENGNEVVGGKLVVWAPDAIQQFPTGFGEDGLLFTGDDPVAAIAEGYTVVDLDKSPFEFDRSERPEFTLYEPSDVAIKDYSGLSYTQAFDNTFETIRKEYAFNGVAGKQPDWDALYAGLKPRVQKAEKDKDANAFYMALRDFTWAFKDGHVSLQAGDYSDRDFSTATAGGYGFAIRELDDGRTLVIYVLEGGPAAHAGMQVGAQVTKFNGQPVEDVIGKARSYALQSSDIALRYQQARYLLRAKPGDKAVVTFTNPGGSEQEAALTAVEERQSFGRTSLYFNVNTDTLLPVDSQLISDGNASVGYVRINSNFDDVNLVIRLFERALKEFQEQEVAGIIIDMRYNNGGANLGLAGFLADREIPLGQLEYYSETTGKFEPEGPRQKVYPNQNQYHFSKTVLLIGPACYSACEIEAYGFSQVPGVVVVGQYPTAGVEAEVARGHFSLPEGFTLQVPTGRFTLPDGSIFLEGQGVIPTLKVPVDESTVLSTEDVVLQAGMKAVLQPLGAGITPSGPPKLANSDESAAALTSGAKFLEDAAREKYEPSQFAAPGTTVFTVPLEKSETLIWAYAWCASDTATLQENLSHISLKFVLDEKPIASPPMNTYDMQSNGRQCRLIYTALLDWPGGEHHLTTTASFKAKINDGNADYEAGEYVLDYAVYVKP